MPRPAPRCRSSCFARSASTGCVSSRSSSRRRSISSRGAQGGARLLDRPQDGGRRDAGAGRPEFRKTFDEQNFGLPLKDALDNLTARIPLLDVRFFATAVLIQRETGGNLAEILENLAHVVRERFKILRQVRVYTAHGRLTGWVLLALPVAFLAIALMFINPDHMNLLFRERMGQHDARSAPRSSCR
jgi:hypothetical protein